MSQFVCNLAVNICSAVSHFEGLISGIEDLGRPLVWHYFCLMLFYLENSHLLHKQGLVFHSDRTVTVDENTAVDEKYQLQATKIELNTSLENGRRP